MRVLFAVGVLAWAASARAEVVDAQPGRLRIVGLAAGAATGGAVAAGAGAAGVGVAAAI